jgi:hypothetical protein
MEQLRLFLFETIYWYGMEPPIAVRGYVISSNKQEATRQGIWWHTAKDATLADRPPTHQVSLMRSAPWGNDRFDLLNDLEDIAAIIRSVIATQGMQNLEEQMKGFRVAGR